MTYKPDCRPHDAIRWRAATDLWLLRMLGLIFLLASTGLAKPARAQTPDLAKLSSEGQAALRDQHFDRAAEVYGQIIKLDPLSAQAHSNLGLALYMAAKYPRAISEFQKALELDPHLD